MLVASHLWTRRIHVQRPRRNKKELLAVQTAVKKRQRGCPPPMKAAGGSPIHSTTSLHPALASHRTADVSSDI
ncbi:hypothetical protein MOQ_000900, partial [Trypanosoma cruzi marinkellei]